MARWCCCLAAGLCLAATGAGCTTTQMGQSWATGTPKANRGIGAAKSDSDDTRIASKSKENSSGKASDDAAARRRTAALEPTRSRAPTPKHSAATMALIERELRDAAPDEREPLLATLRDVPDETVRHILSERRRGLQLVRQQGELAVVKRPEPSEAPVIQASATKGFEKQPPATAPRRQSLNGLGTVHAWGHSTPTRRGTATPDGTASAIGEPTESVVQTAEHQTDQVAPHDETVETTSAELPAALPHGSGYRSEMAVAAVTRPVPATGPPVAEPAAALPKSPPAAAPAKGNPILGMLMPGRFGAAPANAAKPAATNASPGSPKASVAVGVPRETTLGPGIATIGAVADGPPLSGELLETLIAANEAEVAQLTPGGDDVGKRTYIEKHVYLRMLYLIAGQQERALQAIPGIDVADQEFWQQTFWGLTNYFDATSIPLPADRAAQTVSQMTKAVLRLQEKANLELRNVNFCHKIASFGNYEKYPRDEFSPGQEVLLYAEVANIHSEPASDGRFRTSLKSTLEIYRHGAAGEPIEQIELPETVDLCRTHRRDYFHSYQFTIPAKLSLGPHVLKLMVEDQLSHRTTTYSLNFMVK